MKPKAFSDYKFHPACLEYGMLPEAELAELKQNINAFGQLDTIKTYKGFIVDGRNRLHCVLELGLEPRFEELHKDTDPWAYVESVNDRRRHESKEAREKRREKRVARVVAAREEGQSLRAIAEQEGVSKTQVVLDLESSGVQDCPPENEKSSQSPPPASRPKKPTPSGGTSKPKPPPKVTGLDGKSYSSTKKPPANGKPLFDDREFDKHFGALVRFVDNRVKHVGKGPEHNDVRHCMELLLAAWKRWQLKRERAS